MPKITDEELERVSPRLFKKDVERLKQLATPSCGVHRIIREVMHKFVESSFDRLRPKIDEIQGIRTDSIIWPDLESLPEGIEE